MLKDLTFKNSFMFILALALMGAGISVYSKTDIGMGAWDALHGNLTTLFYDSTKLEFGKWVFIVGAITVTVSQVLYPNIKAFLAVITGLILGLFIDAFNDIWEYTGLFSNIDSILLRWVIFTIALLFLGSGIALLVLSKLPPTPIDILMLGYMHRFNLNFNVAKMLTETTAFIVAVIVGIILVRTDATFDITNSIWWGTLIATLTIGLIVQYSTVIWKKIFKITF